MNNVRIQIFTRSANIELYYYSQKLIDIPYKRVRLYGTTADGYIYEMLSHEDCDIAINIDEDAFVVDNDALQSLVDYVIANDIVCCGMRDGGVVNIRTFNPIVQNPFFNIINLKLIREKLNKKEIDNFDYEANREELIKRLPKELQTYEGLKYDNYEPYYHFFLWVAKNFKVMYLNAHEHKDGYTSIIYNQSNQPILMHTWWSREYGKNPFHTLRIKSVIAEAYSAQRKKEPSIFFVKIWRWIENKSQQFAVWMEWWINEGRGRWIIAHAKKTPAYYYRRTIELLKEKCHH